MIAARQIQLERFGEPCPTPVNAAMSSDEVHVYRPQGLFSPRVLGLYPKGNDIGLFSPARWDQAVERWKKRRDPLIPPDRVGVDAAGQGRDKNCVALAWGLDSGSR